MTAAKNRIDPKALRFAFGQFATGVTVITTREDDGTPRGFTANSFTSVSLDPPLILVCIATSAASCDIFAKADYFAVNILNEAQKDISGLFATQRPDKFAATDWSPGENGAPLLDNSLAWFECAHHQAIEAGDHIVLIGRVEAFAHNSGPPLGYFRGNYFSLGVDSSLVDAFGRNAGLTLGALFEKDEMLLLNIDAKTGEISVPSIGKQNTEASLEKFKQHYGQAPLNGTLEFVYAVYEDRRHSAISIYYRGKATGDAPPASAFFHFDEIPWERISDSASHAMLKRYISEARAEEFAIYVGDETAGDVRFVQ